MPVYLEPAQHVVSLLRGSTHPPTLEEGGGLDSAGVDRLRSGPVPFAFAGRPRRFEFVALRVPDLKTPGYRHHCVTHVGWVRPVNEDTLIESPEHHLFGVCDGMGGHAAGEVASALAATVFRRVMAAGVLPPAAALGEAIRQADEAVYRDQMVHPAHKGMGTTLSALLLSGSAPDEAWIGHVGDSRVYRCRNQRLDQLTTDHSPVFRLYRKGLLSKEQARRHPHKHIVEQALGLSPPVEADIFAVDVRPGDLFLLCTDGLSDQVGDVEIEDVCRSGSVRARARHLVQAANFKGGLDNVSVVVVQIL